MLLGAWAAGRGTAGVARCELLTPVRKTRWSCSAAASRAGLRRGVAAAAAWGFLLGSCLLDVRLPELLLLLLLLLLLFRVLFLLLADICAI